MSQTDIPDRAAALTAWPAGDLEHVGSCPACSADTRSILFKQLRDKAFRTGQGAWTMYRCHRCQAAYLDPRPSPQSIHRAYVGYYTQQGSGQADRNHFWLHANLKASLKTGYLNREYGYRFSTGKLFGDWLVRRILGVRREIDYLVRHLPAPFREEKILDVGCGNGEFVALAGSLGFRAVGIDPDPLAIARGQASGLDLREGLLPNPAFTQIGFAHVTFSHVLEHLHDPRGALLQSFNALAPGGRIWLSQPNLGAIGLDKFGENWRGLEAPRHLSLYDFDSLSSLLKSVGFEKIQLMPSELAANFYFQQSAAMAANQDPYAAPDPEVWTKQAQAEAAAANQRSRSNARTSESLTIVAWRPAGSTEPCHWRREAANPCCSSNASAQD